MPPRRPCIGVFDSGFGGLTVLKALLEMSPESDYLYFGDTARLPYGSKSAATVAKYALEATRYLEARGAQLLVIACNTATALALDQIEAASDVPVVGVVVPGADRAARASQKRRVAVIGTEATVASHAYRRALASRGIEAEEKACPLLVPLIEEGWIEHPVTEQVARIYLDEVFALKPASSQSSADVLVLGCTHYPLIRPLLRRVTPAHVEIVDSAESTARAVADRLGRAPLSAGSEEERRRVSRQTFFATDSTEKFQRLGARFLGQAIERVHHVDLRE